MSFEPGKTIGEYTVESVLGQGGLGTVYRVKHNISQRLEAMKVLHPERTETPELAERFRREIQMLASLNHPNIARLHTAFYFDNQLVMMMELVEGEDLRSLSRRTSIGIPQLLDYFLQALRALEYAPRPRRRPSRHQARQHYGLACRPHEAARLRPRLQ